MNQSNNVGESTKYAWWNKIMLNNVCVMENQKINTNGHIRHNGKPNISRFSSTLSLKIHSTLVGQRHEGEAAHSDGLQWWMFDLKQICNLKICENKITVKREEKKWNIEWEYLINWWCEWNVLCDLLGNCNELSKVRWGPSFDDGKVNESCTTRLLLFSRVPTSFEIFAEWINVSDVLHKLNKTIIFLCPNFFLSSLFYYINFSFFTNA